MVVTGGGVGEWGVGEWGHEKNRARMPERNTDNKEMRKKKVRHQRFLRPYVDGYNQQ